MKKEEGSGLTLTELMDKIKKEKILTITLKPGDVLTKDEIKHLGGKEVIRKATKKLLTELFRTSLILNDKLLDRGIVLQDLLKHVILLQKESLKLHFKVLNKKGGKDV